MGLVNLRGEVSCQRALTPEEIRQPETALERIAFLVRDILNDSGVPSERLLGLGLSCPGPVDAGAGSALGSPGFEAWHHVPIADILVQKTGFNVRIENNAYSLALSEKSYGNARDLEDYMLLLVDTGIGSGLISQGRLFAGAHGFSGEIGHTSIRFDGERCSWRKPGLLRAICRHSQPVAQLWFALCRVGGNGAEGAEGRAGGSRRPSPGGGYTGDRNS